jgi:hypothetical protein
MVRKLLIRCNMSCKYTSSILAHLKQLCRNHWSSQELEQLRHPTRVTYSTLHAKISCNHCMTPIRGTRFKCTMCTVCRCLIVNNLYRTTICAMYVFMVVMFMDCIHLYQEKDLCKETKMIMSGHRLIELF